MFYNIIKQGTYSNIKQFNFDPSMYYVSKAFFKSTKHANDDIILLSKSAKGLQEKLGLLNTYCKDWCFTVNTSKTKILIFNKAGRLIKHSFRYGNENIECVSNCICTPGMNLQNFKFIFSHNDPE
jgi:hypothetical protein